MKRYTIVYASEVRIDLSALYGQIADDSGEARALGYLQRIRAFCGSFETPPRRGVQRDDIRPGLRMIGFERRISIAFAVHEDRVEFLRFFYGGRYWERIMDSE